MNVYGNAVTRLIEEFGKLPGVGAKSAQRLAFYVLGMPVERAKSFAEAIVEARTGIHYCRKCQNLTDSELCPICANPRRVSGLIMVVEDPRDMAAYERTKEFQGVYHVLHGAISPMNGVSPSDIKIKELLTRIEELGDNLSEIIVATNPNIEGEATAMYLSRLLKPLGVKVSRIAHGVPVGGDLEHVDEATLSRALENRRIMD